MRLRVLATLATAAIAAGIAAPAAASTATPSPDPRPASSLTTPSPTPSLSVTPEPTASPEPSVAPEPSATPQPSAAPTPAVPTPSAAPSPAAEPSAAPEPAPLTPTMTALATPTTGVFADVSSAAGPRYSAFATEIAWMSTTGISRGWTLSDGSTVFRPTATVTRDAMAAFLYRFVGYPAASSTAKPFTDVNSSSSEFSKEISWLYAEGISTGWRTSNGVEYRPLTTISREAMAAFLYRLAGEPAVTLPSRSPFVDVAASDPFYREITWLAKTGIAEGWTTSVGAEYRPKAAITRDAMAAYLYRLHESGAVEVTAGVGGSTIRHTTLYVYGASSLNFRTGPSTSYPAKAQLSREAKVYPTGNTANGWVEVMVGTQKLWASSYYLFGKAGAAGIEVRSNYSNGRIPSSALCGLSWDSVEFLACAAAHDLELLNAAFRAKFGINLPLNDSYRSYEDQVRAKELYGDLAATPGTSNHGWGLAVDISTARLSGGTSGDQYTWLKNNSGIYNWVLPTWARPSGTKPEPWHFEYTG